MIIDRLKPGGKAGLVLPSGVFNNPSMKPLRDYIRKHAKIIALVGLPHLAFQISGANNEGHLLFIEKVDKLPPDYKIFIDWAPQVGIDTIGRKTDTNDLIGVVERFQDPPKENQIWFSELKERIDPWYYHPNYTRLIKRLQKKGETWVKLGDLFKISSDQFRPGSYQESQILRYVEKGNVDLERGEIHSWSEETAKTIPGRATFVLKENDVLFPDIYDSMRGVAIVPQKYEGAICTSRCFVVRHNPDLISLEFVRHFFCLPEILALMKRECSGEINPGISKDAFFAILVPLPSKEQQGKALEGIKKIQAEKQELYSAIARLDAEIQEKTRESVPHVIGNYDEIKIVRAEFIGQIKMTPQ